MTNGKQVALIWASGEQRYAFPLDAVIEVVHPVWVTPVADTPQQVLGVIQVREAVVPVFDLRRPGSVPSGFLPVNRFVIVKVGARSVAVVVDTVIDLVHFEDGDVHGRDTFASPALPLVVAAVLTLNGQLIALLDLSAVVTASDLAGVDVALEALPRSPDSMSTRSSGGDQRSEGGT